MDINNYLESYPNYALRLKYPIRNSVSGVTSIPTFKSTSINSNSRSVLHTIQQGTTKTLYLLETTDLNVIVDAVASIADQTANFPQITDGATYSGYALAQTYAQSATYLQKGLIPQIVGSSFISITNGVWDTPGFFINNNPQSNSSNGLIFNAYSPSGVSTQYLSNNGNLTSLSSNNMYYKYGVQVYQFLFWVAPYFNSLVDTPYFVFEKPFIPLKVITSFTTGLNGMLMPFDTTMLPVSSIPVYDYNLQDLEQKPQSFAAGSNVGMYILERI